MAIHIVRFGSARHPGEGVRIGTVRRPPRGVRKEDIAGRDFYDVWLPDLAPSAALLSWVKVEPLTDARWERFAREYRREMAEPAAARIIAVLAALSRTGDFSVGCYCADATRCHRSVLAALLAASGAELAEPVAGG